MAIEARHLQQLYRIATADRAIYVFRDRLDTGGGITPATLIHLNGAGLITVGDLEPGLGRLLTVTPTGRAALIASLTTACHHPEDTMTTTPLDLDAIEARANAATDGPWWNDGHEIYTASDTPAEHWIGETCNLDLPDKGAANGAFMASARADVPAMAAEIRRLNEANAAWKAESVLLRGVLDTARKLAESGDLSDQTRADFDELLNG